MNFYDIWKFSKSGGWLPFKNRLFKRNEYRRHNEFEWFGTSIWSFDKIYNVFSSQRRSLSKMKISETISTLFANIFSRQSLIIKFLPASFRSENWAPFLLPPSLLPPPLFPLFPSCFPFPNLPSFFPSSPSLVIFNPPFWNFRKKLMRQGFPLKYPFLGSETIVTGKWHISSLDVPVSAAKLFR